jgi:hypothetical protein
MSITLDQIPHYDGKSMIVFNKYALNDYHPVPGNNLLTLTGYNGALRGLISPFARDILVGVIQCDLIIDSI